MKPLLFLLILIPSLASAWDVPRYYRTSIIVPIESHPPFIKASHYKPTLTPTILPGSEEFDIIDVYMQPYGDVFVSASFKQSRSYTRRLQVVTTMYGIGEVGWVYFISPGIWGIGAGMFGTYNNTYVISATAKLTPYSD